MHTLRTTGHKQQPITAIIHLNFSSGRHYVSLNCTVAVKAYIITGNGAVQSPVGCMVHFLIPVKGKVSWIPTKICPHTHTHIQHVQFVSPLFRWGILTTWLTAAFKGRLGHVCVIGRASVLLLKPSELLWISSFPATHEPVVRNTFK